MKVLKARAGVLTNFEVLTHLESLQSEFEIITLCRKYNNIRAQWRQKGRRGDPPDVPDYQDDVEYEIESDEMKEARRVRVEEAVKAQVAAGKASGKTIRVSKKEKDALEQQERAKDAKSVQHACKNREQYYAVRPVGDPLKYITNATAKYLCDSNYTPARRQTPELVQGLMRALGPYNLTKPEMLQIVNCPPAAPVELWLSIDELDQRIPDESQYQVLIDLIGTYFLSPSDVDASTAVPTVATADEGQAGAADGAYDEEEMAMRGQELLAEDKWGREGLEEVEGRDIDE